MSMKRHDSSALDTDRLLTAKNAMPQNVCASRKKFCLPIVDKCHHDEV